MPTPAPTTPTVEHPAPINRAASTTCSKLISIISLYMSSLFNKNKI